MGWLVGGLVYCAVFLYVLTNIFGLAMALSAQLLILTGMIGIGYVAYRIIKADGGLIDEDDEPPL